MDFDKIAKNVNILAGLEGLKRLLGCIWCQGEKRTAILKFIANKHGLIDLKSPADNKVLPTLIESHLGSLASSNDTRVRLAREHSISPSRVKPIGNGKFIIRGKVVIDEVCENKNS